MTFEKREPYVGARPFETADKDLFFGRDDEIDELFSLVTADRALLVYAQSGAGKTSLINAGLIPLLRREGFDCLPVARVQGQLPEGFSAGKVRNVYAFNVLLSWAEDGANLAALSQLPLAHFLEQRPVALLRGGLRAPRVAIFDQFEELFTSYDEYWEQREPLFQDIAVALKEDPLLRVIFVMREDYIAELDPHARTLPGKLRARFRLERLGEGGALAAVKGPLTVVKTRRFAEGVPERLVQTLLLARVAAEHGRTIERPGPFVEPVLLQAVCQRVWQSLKPGEDEITWKHIQDLADVNSTLVDIYEGAIRSSAARAGRKEGDLRIWLERQLITPAGTRGTVYRGLQETGGIPNNAVDELERCRLIRRETRGGAQWYELTHDRLIGPIQESNQRWLSRWRDADEARQELETKAAEWVRRGRTDGRLSEDKLVEAESWLSTFDTAELSYSSNVPALIRDSRNAIEDARQRQVKAAAQELQHSRRVAAAMMGLFLLALAFAGYALFTRNQAVQASQRAEQQRLLATSHKLRAEATRLARNRLDLALLLSLEARKTFDTPEAQSSLFAVIAENPRVIEYLQPLVTLPIHSVALSRDAKMLATGGPDRTVTLWDLTKRPRQSTLLAGHTAPVLSVAFSNDGSLLASAGEDGSVRLWDVNTRTPKERPLNGHQGKVNSVAFGAGNGSLASAGEDGKVVLWNLTDGPSAPRILTDNKAAIYSVAFSPNGKTLAAGGCERLVKGFCGRGEIVIWDVSGSSPNEKQRVPAHTEPVLSVAFSRDGRSLASASADGTIMLWKWKEGSLQMDGSLNGHRAAVSSVAFGLNGIVASASRDESIILWNPRNKLGQPLTGHSSAVTSVAFAPDGMTLASVSEDANVVVWDARKLDLGGGKQDYSPHRGQQDLQGQDAPVSLLAFSPDGKLVASGGVDNIIRLWDLATARSLNRPLATRAPVTSLTFDPHGQILASSGAGNTIRLWNPATAQALGAPLAGHTAPVLTLAFSPDGKLLASGSADDTIRLWNPAAGQALGAPVAGHTAPVLALAFSPDGKLLASGSADDTIRLWNSAAAPALRALLAGHEAPVLCLAFSRDGKLLASGSADGTIRLWDSTTNQPFGLPLRGHHAPVRTLAFSSDGKILTSASTDNTMRLWNPITGQRLATSTGYDGDVSSVASSLDGTRLVFGGSGSHLTVWDYRLESVRSVACRMVTRNLSVRDWQIHVGSDLSYRKTCPELPAGGGGLSQ